jgi:PAS domain S-box-containing protein
MADAIRSDTSRTKRQPRTRRQAMDGEERYQAFIQNSHEGIWRFELEKPIPIALPAEEQIKLMYKHSYLAEANNAMAAMYGFESTEQLVGTRLPEMLIESDPRNTDYLKAFIESGYSLSGVESHEVDHLGNHKVFRNSLVGFVERGKLVRAWGTQQDITAQTEAQTRLRQSEERLSLALQASRLGMWEWHVVTDELMWADELKKMFGLKPSEKITYKKYIRLVHPLDRERTEAVVQNAMKTGQEYSVEHRTIWPDGSVHWLLGQGKAFIEGGRAVRMIGTVLNIDDRKKAEADNRRTERLKAANVILRAQRQQLVDLNNSKDEFISVASHQLRTPATGVKQYIGMLLQGYCGKLTRDQRAFLEVAYESNERELQIIDNLLKVAQVDAGKVVLAKTKVDITALISKVLQDQASTFEARQQQVEFIKPRSHVMAHADSHHLFMVLENIVDNASKYSPEGKTIIIRLMADHRQVRIAVEDHGVGIAEEDIQRLFQKFSRIDNPLSTQVGGTGIGLYWAKRIIDLHGGTIDVVSKASHGSIFTITIPM